MGCYTHRFSGSTEGMRAFVVCRLQILLCVDITFYLNSIFVLLGLSWQSKSSSSVYELQEIAGLAH